MNTTYIAAYRVTDDVLANKSKRFLNLVIDYLIRLSLIIGLGVIIGFWSELTGDYAAYDAIIESDRWWTDYALGYLTLLIYYTAIESLTSRSVGKYITQTKIVMKDGSKPSFNAILARSFSRLIPFEHFSFIGEESRGWHDSISDTYVIDLKKYNAKIETASELDQIGKAIE
ncbi:MAG: RDD family protein [Bacteroidota bacterium]